MLRQLGRIPVAGEVAEVPLPVQLDSEDDALPQQTAVLRVEHMDGLRVDRVRLSLRVETDDSEGAGEGDA